MQLCTSHMYPTYSSTYFFINILFTIFREYAFLQTRYAYSHSYEHAYAYMIFSLRLFYLCHVLFCSCCSRIRVLTYTHVRIRTYANTHMRILLLFLFIYIFVSPTPILPTLCLHGALRTRLIPCAPCCSFCCMYLLSLFVF